MLTLSPIFSVDPQPVSQLTAEAAGTFGRPRASSSLPAAKRRRATTSSSSSTRVPRAAASPNTASGSLESAAIEASSGGSSLEDNDNGNTGTNESSPEIAQDSSVATATLSVQPGSVSSTHHRRAPRYHGASSHSYNLLPALGSEAREKPTESREDSNTREGSQAEPANRATDLHRDAYSRFPSPEPHQAANTVVAPFTAEQTTAAFAGFSPGQPQPASDEVAKVRWALHLQPVITFDSPLSAEILVDEVSSRLPPPEEARRALLVYHYNVSWMYDVIDDWDAFQREHVAAFYPGLYSSEANAVPADARHPHALALLFMCLSLGSMFDLQRATGDGKPETYFRCAWKLLSLSNAQDHYTIDSVQAFHLIGQYLSNRRSGKGAESFMAVLGLACRHAMSMGLHRDTSDWKEGEHAAEAEERRRLFWDLMATDAFRSLAWGQPPNLNVDIVTTRFAQPRNGEKEDFHTAKWRIISVLNRILWTCFHLPSVSYDTVLRFDAELRELQRTLLPRLEPNLKDVRGVDLDLASVLLRQEDEPALGIMRQELQSRTLAANIEQVLLHLHRPWLLRALQGKIDPAMSPFSHSVLSVQQSSRTLVKICTAVAQRTPRLQVKWVFWAQHAFNAAICQALQVCSAPQSVLVSSVMQDLEEAVQVLDGMRPGLDGQTWERRLQLLDTQLEKARAARLNPGSGRASAVSASRGSSTKELGSLVGAVPRYSTAASSGRSRSSENFAHSNKLPPLRTTAMPSLPPTTLPPPPPSTYGSLSPLPPLSQASIPTGLSTTLPATPPWPFPTMSTGQRSGSISYPNMDDLAVFAPSDLGQQNALLSGILGEETFESDSGFWMSLLGLSSELH